MTRKYIVVPYQGKFAIKEFEGIVMCPFLYETKSEAEELIAELTLQRAEGKGEMSGWTQRYAEEQEDRAKELEDLRTQLAVAQKRIEELLDVGKRMKVAKPG